MTTLLEAIPPTIQEDLNGSHALTEADIAFLRENGYIKLKNVLEPETVRFFDAVITEQVKLLNTMDLHMEQRSTYQKAFLQVTNIWTKDDTVKAFSFAPKLARLAAELLEVSGVRMYHDQALYKEPGGGITPWHADQYYWPVSGDRTITAWIPLQETRAEMGPLAFARKTHRMAFGRDLEISDESDSAIYLLNPEVVTAEGEWEAWLFANWLPGASRYRSFAELMEAEYRTFRERDT